VDIGPNTGSGSADLITDDRFVLAFKVFDQIQDFNRKGNREVNKFI
jgi:hypothetical protein